MTCSPNLKVVVKFGGEELGIFRGQAKGKKVISCNVYQRAFLFLAHLKPRTVFSGPPGQYLAAAFQQGEKERVAVTRKQDLDLFVDCLVLS